MPAKRSPLKAPIHFVLDWDGTITQKDTLDALVSIAASSKPRFPILDRWKYVVDAYISDYTSTLETLGPDGALPTTIEGERKLLKDLKVMEQRSLDRIFEAKIFEGVTQQQIEEGAKKAIGKGDVALRPGYPNLVQCLTSNSSEMLHLLSVNWSRHFIASCNSAAGIQVGTSLILANELDGIVEERPSSGQISPDGDMKIIASDDKLQHLKEIKNSTPSPIVYVGDSWTDIECLLAADLGICIRDEPMGSSQKKLAGALERLGVACPHLSGWQEAGQSSIVWARDFVEIQELVLSASSNG